MTTARSSWILAAFVFLSCNGKWFATEPNKENCTTDVGAIACKDEGGQCDVATGKCRKDLSCASAVDCAMGSAAWCKDGQCVPCDVDTRCVVWTNARNPSPRRDYCASLTNSPNTCAQCRPGQDKTDCTDLLKPTCDAASGLCRACAKDSDCASGVCRKPGDYPTSPPVAGLMTGQCVSSDSIAYVNNSGTPACAGTNSGSQTEPVCTVMQAQTLTPARAYIRLIGSGTPYVIPAVAAGGNLVIVGPGHSANPGAQVTNPISVTGGSLVLQGVQITQTTVVGMPAVRCSGGSLFLLDSSVVSDYKGVDGTGCGQLYVERTRVSSGQRGILVSGPYRIVNTAVASAGTGGGVGGEEYAVDLTTGATGYFAFNTITRYFGGVRCLPSLTLTDSIIVTSMNDVGGCMTQRVVTGANNVELATGLEPKLLNKGAKNTACCIDQGRMPASNEPVPTDFYGTARPNGEEYDIGFHEIN